MAAVELSQTDPCQSKSMGFERRQRDLHQTAAEPSSQTIPCRWMLTVVLLIQTGHQPAVAAVAVAGRTLGMMRGKTRPDANAPRWSDHEGKKMSVTVLETATF